MKQKHRRGRSVQELLGVRTFTKYGLMTHRGELLFYLVAPTNISVLSHVNVEIKIQHLMLALSEVPDLEILCTDASECFDDNKVYLRGRLEEEWNPSIRALLQQDIDFLDQIQVEMSSARQFLFVARAKGMKEKQVFDYTNRIEKALADQGFEAQRLQKPEIKRLLALWLDASLMGEQMPDQDGSQYLQEEA